MATTLSFRLIEIACHDSYPLNSDIASPPGTFAEYLSLSCAEVARPPRAASHTVATPIVSMLLRFIEAPRADETRRARRDPSDEGIDGAEIGQTNTKV